MIQPDQLATVEQTSVHLSTFGVWRYDVGADRFVANELTRQLLKLEPREHYSAAEIIGQFHPQYRSSIARLLEGDFSESQLLTVRLLTDDVLPTYFNIQANASRDSSGDAVVDGMVFESSTGMKMREQIASSKIRFDALADALPNAFMYMTPDLVVQFASSALGVALGKTVEQMIGQHARDVLGEKEFERHVDVMHKAQAGTATEYEAVVPDLAGTLKHLRISTSPVRDAEGRVIGIVSEAADITDLRMLEKEARRGESAFRMLAEGVPNQLLFLDDELHVQFANDAFLEAAGWTRENAIGKHMQEIIGEEKFLDRFEHYKKALAGESVAYEAVGAIGRDTGYFRFSYRPAYDASGHVKGLFSMAVDITDRREAELALEAKQEELARSNKDLEQFAYVASHDLKSPLRAIELLVEWLTESLEDLPNPEVHENLALLTKRAGRLNRLLDDLLRYSRAGRKVGEHGLVDTGKLVADVIELCNPPEHVTVSIRGELPVFETYATPLEQVFRNLIGNAIKHYDGNDGRVSISCEENAVGFIFAVEDNGKGIPQEYATKVFEMFQTLQPRDQVEGSGMGLSIVKRIVEWQGGRVWFETPASGTGTVFRFHWLKRLPRSKDGE